MSASLNLAARNRAVRRCFASLRRSRFRCGTPMSCCVPPASRCTEYRAVRQFNSTQFATEPRSCGATAVLRRQSPCQMYADRNGESILTVCQFTTFAKAPRYREADRTWTAHLPGRNTIFPDLCGRPASISCAARAADNGRVSPTRACNAPSSNRVASRARPDVSTATKMNLAVTR